MEERSEFNKAKKVCWRLLALRDHGERELAGKLKNKGFEIEIIAEAIDYFRELGYLNDQVFASNQARRLATGKGYGNRKIVSFLLEKGLSEAVVAEAIITARQECSEAQALISLIRKKTTSGDIRNNLKSKQRLARNLMGKGFPLGLIFEMINRSEEEDGHDDDSK
ncbi:MAG: recombination regulator RecX [Syntrophales bacterium]|jgi:regulatory protein|nr:recombination regulator RecX [Syntrophales bacterium]MCK9390135.1 recombination regulator RecX [Syntrophales bacterium]